MKGTCHDRLPHRRLSAFAALIIASVTGPAGSSATPACGGAIVQIKDPGLRASFEKFEATAVGDRREDLRVVPQRRRIGILASP